MPDLFDNTVIWWITVVELPVFSALFWFILKNKQDNDAAIDALQDMLERRTSQMREGLMAFKLEVAKSYASVGDVKDLENRIVAHLLRIESKLDRTALKTEALHADKD